MNAQQLKRSILKYAMEGNLDTGNPLDDPVEELMDSIKATKEKLIKNKIIKKPVILPSVSDDEIPFEVPSNWTWARLGDIVQFINGRAYKKNELLSDENLTPVLRVGNLFTNNTWYYSDLELPEDKYCSEGDLLYAWSASFGPHIWTGKKSIYHYHIWKVRLFEERMKKFIYYHLLKDASEIKKSTTGSTMIHITKGRMESMLIPLPPIQEQQRIVDLIEKILSKVETYNETKVDLDSLYFSFPPQLEKSILQYAIQGKLVEQDTSDEPASELLKRISEQKERMIKEKIIKKEKPLPPITEEEIPFDIPETWEWVRIKDVYYNDGQIKPDQTFYYVDVSAIDNKKGEISKDIKLTSKESAPSRARKITSYGDILYSTVRPYLKNIAIVDVKKDMPLIASTAFVVMRPIEIYNEYLYYVLKSPYFDNEVKNRVQGVTYPAINDTNFNSLLVPIPPLNEQHRIVSKIKNILLYIDDLTSF